jgi:hypothetical protein
MLMFYIKWWIINFKEKLILINFKEKLTLKIDRPHFLF